MSTWSEYYKDRVRSREYADYFSKKYSLFLHYISEQIQLEMYYGKKVKVAEFGCGIGSTTKWLNQFIYSSNVDTYVIDVCSDMLELCRENLSYQAKNVQFIQHDIRKGVVIPNLDVIHSHGVLEHFQDDDIRKIIGNQLKLCNNLIHYVPSDKYEEPIFGDERLMSPEQWNKICEPNDILDFNEGKDLILIWGENE